MAINGLNVHKILELDYIDFSTSKKPLEGILSVIFRGLENVYAHEKNYKLTINNDYDFLFVKSLERPSYDKLWNSIQRNCSHSSCELSFSTRGKYLSGSFDEIKIKKLHRCLRTIFHTIKYLPLLFLIKKQQNFTHRIMLYFYLLVLAVEADKISKINFKHLVVFADMQRVDNFLVQYFKKTKTTITLQHGLYVDYSKNPNLNIVNYKNVVSKYFLAWGEETKTLIKRYHPNCNVIVCGNPIDYPKVLETSEQFFTVLMDQRLFHEYNQKMLNIAFEFAEKMGMKVNIRIHPKDDINDYTTIPDLIATNVDDLQSSFAIGHTSTMIFEMMAMGMPTYKFKSDVPSNLINEKLIFETVQELFLLRSLVFDFEKESEYYLSFVGRASEKQYKRFFDSIEKNKK